MTTFLARAACVALLALSTTACGPLLAANRTPPGAAAAAEWPAVQERAAAQVRAERYVEADRVLADFTARYPATLQAQEAGLRRALYMLDPANQSAGPREAAALLDDYIATSTSVPHRTDAQALRRLVTALQARPATVTVTAPSGGAASAAPATPASHAAEDRARDEELARVKEQLAKANAELERIKKRLSGAP